MMCRNSMNNGKAVTGRVPSLYSCISSIVGHIRGERKEIDFHAGCLLSRYASHCVCMLLLSGSA